jgi:hypothetical protein
MLKLFHAHYEIIDPAFGFAKCIDKGDTTLVIDTEDEGDFDVAIAKERSKISKEHELTDERGCPKVVFTNFSLLHSEDVFSTVETVPVVKCFEGDRVVASVKSNQPKFL